MIPPDSIIVRRRLAIGDSICASVIAEKMADAGFVTTYQTDPLIVPVVKRNPRVQFVEPVNGHCNINLDGAYERDPNRNSRHFHEMFVEKSNAQLDALRFPRIDQYNYKPRLSVTGPERLSVGLKLSQYPKPWVFICPRSNTYRPRQVPDRIWEAAARKIHGTVFWLGTFTCPPGIIDLAVHRIELLPAVIASASLMVTVDTGPMHIAAALGVPIVALYQSSNPELHLNDQNDFEMISLPLNCLNCQKNICPISQYEPPCGEFPPQMIADAVNRKLAIFTERVSAVIPIYKPPAVRLTRCVNAVLDQVDEVIITAEGNSVIPEGAPRGPKIRYVQTRRRSIGYGQNVNYGVRHSSGEFILILNDDVYLDAGAVAELRRCMRGDVALVGQFLRYPNGTIYHGGVARSIGSLDWGHIDHGKYNPTITEPREMEQVTGASILVRRSAFYQADGFDERFHLYCEDNDLCMKIRQNGWKIWYSPLATGVHEGSASASDVPGVREIMLASQRLFHHKWDWYLKRNINNTLGTF